MTLDQKKIAGLREDFTLGTLGKEKVADSPFLQFEKWFEAYLETKGQIKNAMTLATSSPSGIPSARVVLLKGIDENGFKFYTNYQSRKGQELLKNPNAALVFYWPEMDRQVRVEGKVQKMSYENSNAYFQSRPKESQIGAHASPQSQEVPNRQVLESNVVALREQYKDQEALPCPEHWGGFCVVPHRIEFWQGRKGRMHDRICYTLEGTEWKTKRLAP